MSSETDVRNLRGRVVLAAIACWCGALGATCASMLVTEVMRHSRCPGNCGSAQADYFRLGAVVFAFLLCGTAGGVAYQWWQRRAGRIRLPRAVVRTRSRDRVT